MSNYDWFYTDDYKKDLKKLKSNFKLQKRLQSKTKEILKNPSNAKPLRNILKNKRRIHLGSFVLIFEIKEDENIIIFHSLKHHDEAYK